MSQLLTPVAASAICMVLATAPRIFVWHGLLQVIAHGDGLHTHNMPAPACTVHQLPHTLHSKQLFES